MFDKPEISITYSWNDIAGGSGNYDEAREHINLEASKPMTYDEWEHALRSQYPQWFKCDWRTTIANALWRHGLIHGHVNYHASYATAHGQDVFVPRHYALVGLANEPYGRHYANGQLSESKYAVVMYVTPLLAGTNHRLAQQDMIWC